MVEDAPASAGDVGSVPGREAPLEKDTAARSSILTRRTPWTEEPGGRATVLGHKRGGHGLAAEQQQNKKNVGNTWQSCGK